MSDDKIGKKDGYSGWTEDNCDCPERPFPNKVIKKHIPIREPTISYTDANQTLTKKAPCFDKEGYCWLNYDGYEYYIALGSNSGKGCYGRPQTDEEGCWKWTKETLRKFDTDNTKHYTGTIRKKDNGECEIVGGRWKETFEAC